MVRGNIRSDPNLGLEKFYGEDFTMWRDKAITYIKTLDEAYQRELLEKDKPRATVVMMDFLDGTPEKPVISVEGETSQEEAKIQRWRYQHWARAHKGLLNLFNLTLPNGFLSGLSDQVSKLNPVDVWKALEQKYGVGDAGGVIELLRKWKRLTTSNWSNLGTLFAQLKKLRNDINRKMRGLVGSRSRMWKRVCVACLVIGRRRTSTG